MPGKRLTLSAVIMFMSSSVVMSAEWAFEPSVTMSATHSDNFRLSTAAESASGMILHPKIRLSKRTEATEIQLSGHTRSVRYDNSRFDSDEIMLDFGSSFENTERSTFKFNAGFSRKPVITTEEEDSGRFEIEQDRDRISFSPSWEYKLSSSSLLQVSYSGQDVDYNDSTSFTSYQYHSLEGHYLFKQSEKNQYGISLVASRYDPNGMASTTIGENCVVFFFPSMECAQRNQSDPLIEENAPATSNITDSVGFNLGVTRNFHRRLLAM